MDACCSGAGEGVGDADICAERAQFLISNEKSIRQCKPSKPSMSAKDIEMQAEKSTNCIKLSTSHQKTEYKLNI